MKRSRRSLALLLGLMAASLAVVRATTQSAIDTPGLAQAENSPTVVVNARSVASHVARPSADMPGGRGLFDRRGPSRRAKPRPVRGLSADGRSGLRRMTRRPKQPVSPFMAKDRPGNVQLSPEQNNAPRPVSAICIILVVPDMSEPSRPRAGWSGCSAYAVGCDHLGRSVPERKDDTLVGALNMPWF